MYSMEEIYRDYAQPVYKYLMSITRDANLAEELTQETFYQAIMSIKKFNGQCKILVWLCQIGKHLFYNHLKKEKRRTGIDWDALANDEDLSLPDTPETDLIGIDDTVTLYRAVHNLPEPYREVVFLRLSCELDFREIGEIMGQTTNWACVTFYRAKIKLLERMENNEQ